MPRAGPDSSSRRRGSCRGRPFGCSTRIEPADGADATVGLQDGLLTEHEIERLLDGVLLRLCAEELLGAVDLRLIVLPMLVPRHVHERGYREHRCTARSRSPKRSPGRRGRMGIARFERWPRWGSGGGMAR